MLFHVVFLLISVCTSIETKKYHRFGDEKSEQTLHPPQQRLLVDVDIYNRPYALPYFLRQLEDLKCPVIECLLDLHLYHVYQNDAENETMNFVRQWVKAMPRTQFSTITIDEWTAIDVDDRANRLGKTLQKSAALNATYLAMFDSMVVLLEPEKLLSTLMSKDKPLMAPLLRSTKGVYSSTFYFDDQREENFPRYRQIYEREKRGCFLLDGGIKDFYFFNFDHSSVRDAFRTNIDMQLTEVYSVEQLAKKFHVPMYICNREVFGYLPAQYIEVMNDETIIRELYLHMLIEHQLNGPSQTYLPPIRRTSLVPSAASTTKTKFGFDEIYVINLLRRQDRRERLEATFDMLNISARFFEAVDGKSTIDQTYLENLNIRLLPDYEDPYNHRPMNYGELGCFFSHYFIWKDVVEKNYENGVLILEDDVRFDVYFKYKLERVFANRSFDWDLIYLGRKVMRPDEENFDEAFQTYLVKPAYSHWTVGYALSLRAAKILVAENPLQKILPVDEYLPIMIDRHPNLNWKSHFQNRTLKAFAFEPTIVSPTHYFGEPNYISDTENTTVLNATKVAKEIVSVDVVQTDNSVGAKDEL